MTKAKAAQYLTARYREQCDRFPRTREIPLALYIDRNWRQVIKNAKERAKWEDRNVDSK